MFRTAQNNYSSTPSKNWYAIYVRSRHEKSVYSELQQKGIESSLPLVTQTRQWSDRRKKVEVPSFRGYVFVKIDLKTEKLAVLQTPGVVKFVHFNQITVPIPEQQMYWLQQMINSRMDLKQEQELPLGAEVEVMFGPLRGIRGRVKQKNSKSRFVVWFDTIMQGVSVEIDTACVSPISHKDKHIQPVQTGGYIM